MLPMNKKMPGIAFVLGVALLCSIPAFAQEHWAKKQEESTEAQNNVSKDNIMGKKDLGSLLALYPKPLTVVGAMVNGNPTG